MDRAIGPILFPFTGTSAGGSHVSTFTLAQALRDSCGVDVHVAAPAGTSIANEAQVRDLPVIENGKPKLRRLDVSDLTGFARRRAALAALGPNAFVHLSDLWTMATWGPVVRSLGRPIVYHNRAFGAGDWLDRRLTRLADAVICISDACRTRLRGVDGMDVTTIINPFSPPSGTVERADARAEWEERWPIPGLRLIGTSGNFVPRKRPEFFLDAAAATAAIDPAARFILFGHDRDGSQSQLEARAAGLGIADRVAFAGFRSSPERNLIALDVLAVPALAEPFGRTLVEALVLGVPYVATDDAGHSEIHARFGGGVAVPVDGSADAFGAAIAAVAADPAHYRLDPARLADAREQVNPASHAAAVMTVYRRMLAQRGGR